MTLVVYNHVNSHGESLDPNNSLHAWIGYIMHARAADNSRSPDKFRTKQPLVLSTMVFVRTNMNNKPWVKNYDCQMSGQT